MARSVTTRSQKASLAHTTGAQRTPFPAFVKPCLAKLQSAPPEGDAWTHEEKTDGYRLQAHLRSGRATLYTRKGFDWTHKFSTLARALQTLTADAAVFDGEVAVFDSRGISDFHALQADLAAGRTNRLVYVVFDVLYLDGYDLRSVPLEDRQRMLAELVARRHDVRLRMSEFLEGDGPTAFRTACARQMEGIVSKKRGSMYRSGEQHTWIKSKCRKTETYPIVAFVEKLGARPRRIASLYVRRRDRDLLLYAGKVGTGYTEAQQYELRERLNPLIRATSPLSIAVKKPKATWVEPLLEAEVEYGNITSAGVLRAASFKGIRDDLLPQAAQSGAANKSRQASHHHQVRVPKENILQLLPDAVIPSEEQLTRYWRKVAARALKYLAGRPLKLVRHVHGTAFYHKGRLPPVPASVRQLRIEKREGGEGTRVWVDDLGGLLGLVEMNVIEVHPWNSKVDHLERADQLVFDLDPGEGVEWAFVREVALVLRELLRVEILPSWPKVTGGKGIHVMVPLDKPMTHDEAHRYSRNLAQRLAAIDPRRLTISAEISARKGRLFLDYLRNGRGTTAVGTYSPRARPGFPVAAPVTWKQIESGIQPDAFSLSRPFRAHPSRGRQELYSRRNSGLLW